MTTIAELRALLARRIADEPRHLASLAESMRRTHAERRRSIELAIVAAEVFDLIDPASLADDDELRLKAGELRDGLAAMVQEPGV